MGEDPSDWSSWGNRVTEPSEKYVSRNILEPVDEQNNGYDSHLIQGGDAFLLFWQNPRRLVEVCHQSEAQ